MRQTGLHPNDYCHVRNFLLGNEDAMYKYDAMQPRRTIWDRLREDITDEASSPSVLPYFGD